MDNLPRVLQASVFGEPSKILPYVDRIPRNMYSASDIVIVEAPCLNIRAHLFKRDTHTLKDILECCLLYSRLLKQRNENATRKVSVSLHDISLFSLTVRFNKRPQKLNLELPISQYHFKDEQIIWLHLEILPLKVNIIHGEENRTIDITPDSHIIISDLEKSILQQHAYLPSNFRLYYTVNNKQKVMEPKRCLLFYRLAKGETLTFKECDEPSYEKTLQNLVVGTSDIVITVSCPHLGYVRKLRFQRDASFAEVLSRFAEKSSIGELGYYDIILKDNGTVLNPLFRICDFVKTPTCEIELQKRNEAELSDSGSEKDHQFGIYLGSGKDCNGCLVPQILIDFHKFLTSNNAFHTEGIFRITGCTKLVENILKELSGPPSSYVYGGSLYEWQIHEVSSLIKRWFMSMPSRLFSGVTDAQLRTCAQNSPPEKIYNFLSPTYQELLRWLVNLLTDAVTPETKMNAFNLGLVFAPCIACEDDVALATQVTVTKYTTTILEKNITKELEKRTSRNTLPTLSRSNRSRAFNVTELPKFVTAVSEPDMKSSKNEDNNQDKSSRNLSKSSGDELHHNFDGLLISEKNPEQVLDDNIQFGISINDKDDNPIHSYMGQQSMFD